MRDREFLNKGRAWKFWKSLHWFSFDLQIVSPRPLWEIYWRRSLRQGIKCLQVLGWQNFHFDGEVIELFLCVIQKSLNGINELLRLLNSFFTKQAFDTAVSSSIRPMDCIWKSFCSLINISWIVLNFWKRHRKIERQANLHWKGDYHCQINVFNPNKILQITIVLDYYNYAALAF